MPLHEQHHLRLDLSQLPSPYNTYYSSIHTQPKFCLCKWLQGRQSGPSSRPGANSYKYRDRGEKLPDQQWDLDANLFYNSNLNLAVADIAGRPARLFDGRYPGLATPKDWLSFKGSGTATPRNHLCHYGRYPDPAPAAQQCGDSPCGASHRAKHGWPRAQPQAPQPHPQPL